MAAKLGVPKRRVRHQRGGPPLYEGDPDDEGDWDDQGAWDDQGDWDDDPCFQGFERRLEGGRSIDECDAEFMECAEVDTL
ncbi:MAG: hypothetical protein ACJAZO_000845 [Myxococcota bacterium]